MGHPQREEKWSSAEAGGSTRFSPARVFGQGLGLVLVAGLALALSSHALQLRGVALLVRLRFSAVPHLSTAELAQWLHDPGRIPPLLLDARAESEFQTSHLPGALNLPFLGDVNTFLREVHHDQPVVVYCSVGYRSAVLVQRLRAAGLPVVLNLEGSIFQWAMEERALVSSTGRAVRWVHPFDALWGLLLPEPLRAPFPG